MATSAGRCSMGRLVGVIGTYAVWAILQVIVVEVGRVGLAKLRLRHGEVAIERESERGRDDGCDVHRVQHGGSEVPIGGADTGVEPETILTNECGEVFSSSGFIAGLAQNIINGIHTYVVFSRGADWRGSGRTSV